MQAERLILEADEAGDLRDLPKFPPRTQVEAFFVVLRPPTGGPLRTPPPELATMTHVLGDIVATALEHDAALLTKDATILRYSGIRVQA
jgi:hypothetical protein